MEDIAKAEHFSPLIIAKRARLLPRQRTELPITTPDGCSIKVSKVTASARLETVDGQTTIFSIDMPTSLWFRMSDGKMNRELLGASDLDGATDRERLENLMTAGFMSLSNLEPFGSGYIRTENMHDFTHILPERSVLSLQLANSSDKTVWIDMSIICEAIYPRETA